MLEDELQYLAPKDFDFPDTLVGLEKSRQEHVRVEDTYYDTADRVLFAAGIVLRLRQENGTQFLTVKKPVRGDKPGQRRREEYEVAYTQKPPKLMDLPDYAKALIKKPLVVVGIVKNERMVGVYGQENLVVQDQITYPDGHTECRLELEGWRDKSLRAKAAKELEKAYPLSVPPLSKGETLQAHS